MTGLRRVVRGVVVAGVALLASLAAGEILARAVTGLGAPEARRERQDFIARIPGSTATPDAEGARRIVQMAYGSRFELHPYFGYTSARGEGDANRHGFASGGIEYPYERASDEFVIGIFGGSVAMQLAGHTRALIERVRPVVAEKGYTRVTVLSFSGGAWRQPQTLFAFLYYFSSIDAAIVLDGFNEIIQLSPSRLETWPAAFPAADIYAALARSSAYDAGTLGQLVWLNETAVAVTERFDGSVVGSSVLAHLAWRALVRRYVASAERLRRSIAESETTRPSDPSTMEAPQIEATRYYRLYEDSIRTMGAVGVDRGIPVLHFVQPNQYDRGAKPLSREEREQFTTAGYFDHVTDAYDRLEAMSARLRAVDVESYHLGDLFADDSATMYSDSCCHLNDDGLDRLGETIGDFVARSPQLDLVGPAAPPPSP